MAANPDLQVSRRIHFYRLDAGVQDGEPVALNIDEILAEIDAEPLGSPERYVDFGDDRLLVLVDQAHANHRLRLVRTRDRDIPQKELAGVLAALPLADGEGIADVVHVILYPHGPQVIIGAEFNFYGARASALAYYMEKVSQACPPVRARPLMRRDFAEALQRASHIKLLDIRVHRTYLDRLAQIDDDLFKTIDAARRLGDPEEFELIIRPKLHSRGQRLGDSIVGTLERLLGQDDVTDGVDRLRIETAASVNHPSEPIDLLQTKMIFSTTMLRLNASTRAIANESAYTAIHDAWQANSSEILSASML